MFDIKNIFIVIIKSPVSTLSVSKDSNGVLDGDEVFGQTLELEIVTEDEVITQVTVDMETNGNIAQNLTIESMQDVDALSSNVVGLMGEPLEFTSATEFDSATISFTIDQSKLGDTAFDNLMILWYNEEEGIFEEMPTDRDRVNSTVSTTTTHFSQYLVVDSVKWYAAWDENLINLRKMYVGNTTEYRNVHTIYLVDCSQGMSTDHPSLQLRVGYNGVTEENFSKYQEEIDSAWESTSDSIMVRWCKRSTICNNMLANKWDYDQAAVIQFSDRILRQSSLTSDMETLKQELIAFPQSAQGVADVNVALEAARSYIQTGTTDLYRVVIITNGEAEFDSSAFEAFPSHTSIAVVNLISTWMPDTLNDADWNGIATVYDTVSADDLTTELTTPDGHTVTTTTYNNADSDGDGIPNIVEQYGLKPNGQPIGTDYKNPDTDGDGLTDGVECGFVSFDAILKATSGYVKYVSCLSDPTLVDTDGDGIYDNEELCFGSETPYSNPLSKDSDNDGIGDFSDPQPTVENKAKDVNWDLWSSINAEEYMAKRCITEIVFKGVHEVAFGNYHTSVIVFANSESEYYNRKEFSQYGDTWSENWRNIHYLTMGAGPKEQIAFDPLTSGYNRNKDVMLDIKVQMVNLTDSHSVNEQIDRLLTCHQYFNDLVEELRPSYDLFPQNENEQNSNSYAVGLLIASGIDDLGMPEYSVPGYKFPLASSYFGVDMEGEEGCKKQ